LATGLVGFLVGLVVGFLIGLVVGFLAGLVVGFLAGVLRGLPTIRLRPPDEFPLYGSSSRLL